MSIGPLRRSIGALGLVVLIPLAWMVAAETITPVDAATRAAIVLVGVTALGRLASLAVTALASSLEQVAAVDHDRQAAASGHRTDASGARPSGTDDPGSGSHSSEGALMPSVPGAPGADAGS